MIDPDVREREALRILDEWPWALGGVVIGGYAVCAYGPPRYSVDVDVVIPYDSAARVRTWLKERGFRLEQHAVPNPQNYEGQVDRFTTDEVTLDLFVGAVRDREARVDISESWIAKRPRRVRLRTVSGTTQRPIPIARPEALWVLKLQVGRDSDLSDLFAIMDEPIDAQEVVRMFHDIRSDSLIARLREVRGKLERSRLYEDSLSRRDLGRPSDPANRRKWSQFVARVDRILGPAINAEPP